MLPEPDFADTQVISGSVFGPVKDRLTEVQALLDACVALRQNYQRRSRERAPDHNLFRLLRVTRSEVGLHSPMLADLLDPFGTHGQGGVFLRAFLDMLSNHKRELSALAREVTEPIRPGDWTVVRERSRIDVSIQNRKLGVLIFIENKIDAAEQHEQLIRYRDLLDGRARFYKKRLLIYLQPKASPPPQTGTPDICLTYEFDIARWLRSCARVVPEHLRSNLWQYLDVIDHLSVEKAMPFRHEMISLLSKAEHIGAVLEIEKCIAKVRPGLHHQFWEAVRDRIQTEFQAKQLVERWACEPVPNLDPFEKPLCDNAGFRCVVRRLGKHTPLLHATIGVAQKGLYTAVGFTTARPGIITQDIAELRDNLEREGFQRCKGKDEEHWLVSMEDGEKLEDESFLTRVASDVVLVAEESVEPLIALLVKHGEKIKAIEEAFAGSVSLDGC